MFSNSLGKALGNSNTAAAQDKNEQLANLVEATNVEGGITALGGISAPATSKDNVAKTGFGSADLKDQQEELQVQASSNPYTGINDDLTDYLVLPGATKTRPRSAMLTHTIGAMVTGGAMMGAGFGAFRDLNWKEFKSEKIARSNYLTAIIRRARNNAIRFGTFGTLLGLSGVLWENVYESKLNSDLPPEPTEEEYMEMMARGIQYQPPPRKELDAPTQQKITTIGIYSAGMLLTLPKSIDLWRNSKKFSTLQQATVEAESTFGAVEKAFINMYGKRSTGIDTKKLPMYLKTMSGCRIAGMIIFCTAVDQYWKSQRDSTNDLVRKASSRLM